MPEALAEHFSDLEQQRDAAHLGMWVFLATEVLFFGGLFAAYTVYRTLRPELFHEAGRHMDLFIGSVNTAILLTSSLSMALAVEEARKGRRRRLFALLCVTAVLGACFLGLKGLEYHHHFVEGLVPGPSFRYPGPDKSEAQMFFYLYYAMTGLHTLHVTIGVLALAAIAVLALRGWFTEEWHTPVELIGLYWHFVDIVWIFLYPLIYLIPKK